MIYDKENIEDSDDGSYSDEVNIEEVPASELRNEFIKPTLLCQNSELKYKITFEPIIGN